MIPNSMQVVGTCQKLGADRRASAIRHAKWSLKPLVSPRVRSARVGGPQVRQDWRRASQLHSLVSLRVRSARMGGARLGDQNYSFTFLIFEKTQQK